MRAGKVASIILVLIITAVACAAGVVVPMVTSLPALGIVHLGLLAAVSATLAAIALVPCGFLVDRAVARMLNSLADRPSYSPDPTGPSEAVAGVRRDDLDSAIVCEYRWLSPLSRALTGVVEQFRGRERQFRGQVHDLEIRLRVAEHERMQIEHALNALGDGVLVTDAFNELIVVNEAAAEILGMGIGSKVQSPKNQSPNHANQADQPSLDFGHLDFGLCLHRSIEEVIRDERVKQLIREARAAGDFTHARHVELEIGSRRDQGIKASRDQGIKASRDQGIKGSREADHLMPRCLDASMPSGDASMPSRLFDVSVQAVANAKGEVAGVVTILHDLTKIREISQMKSDFVSKASHELRTPLSSIRAYVEMLVDGEAADDRARQEFYRIMQGETDRLGRLIDNMLNISRIEAGIIQVQREQVDFKRLIERAIHTIQPQADAKGISLHWRPPATAVDVSVEGDADMLYQVVLNLMSNAVKYTPGNETGGGGQLPVESGNGSAANGQLPTGHSSKAGNRITIVADTNNLTRSVVVTVSDTGLGIPPDALPKLFDKFFRIENYKRVAKGTGLGLNLCKHIVETVHHGQIGVESTLGMGSKFWFSVPMRYAGSGSKSEAGGTKSDGPGKSQWLKNAGGSQKSAA